MESNSDLMDFMKAASLEMENEYVRIMKRATEDPGTAGDQGEENWASLLRNWLPHNFHIVTKGRVLSHNGIASPQVDIIVLRPEYPKQLLDKKLFLAGGILAIFECKTTLKANHIEKFFKNSVLIKNSIRKKKGTPYNELNCGIIYGLLAHSHSWKGKNSKPLDLIQNKIIIEDHLKVNHPINMPDLIGVADLALWSSSKMTYMNLGRMPNLKNISPNTNLNPCMKTSYGCYSGNNDKNNPIGGIITTILNKIAWEYPALQSLAEYFNASRMKGTGKGILRNWDTDVYSEKTLKKLETQGTTGKQWSDWCISL